jgi:hypothetical protein
VAATVDGCRWGERGGAALDCGRPRNGRRTSSEDALWLSRVPAPIHPGVHGVLSSAARQASRATRRLLYLTRGNGFASGGNAGCHEQIRESLGRLGHGLFFTAPGAVYIQAKRWEGSVGGPVVQGFAGSLMGHGASKGVMITTSHFTEAAKTFVEKLERKIVLIDGALLAEFMIDFGIGVTEVANYSLKRLDTDYFEGDAVQ